MHDPRSRRALGRQATVLLVVAALVGLSRQPPSASLAAPAGPDLLDLVSPLGPGPLPLAPRIQSGLAGAAPAQEPTSPWERIDACVAEEMLDERGPGAAIAVFRDGEVVYRKGYGRKGAADDAADVDADTQFRIGSVTKMLTAAAVMQEVDAGRVDLQAPVTTYIPELKLAEPGEAESISVWNLLTHSAGYPDNVLLGLDSMDGPREDAALGAWAAGQTKTRLHAPPGSFWNYSNSGFALAGLVAERSSGLTYHQLMAERIFARAGLSQTTLLPADVLARGNYSLGTWTDPRTGMLREETPDSYDNWAAAPAGFAFSTAEDLVRWAALLMQGGGKVLSREAAEAMQARQQSLDYYPDYDYGLGIMRERYRGLDLMSHGGNVPGWGAYLLWVPAEDFAVATLVNAYPATLDAAALCAVDVLLEPQEAPLRPPAGDPLEWPGFLGRFGGLVLDGSQLRTEVLAKADGSLEMVFPDIPIDMQGTPFRTNLWSAFLRTFGIDGDGDGRPDNAITFIPDRKDPTRLWLRNRAWVLARPAWAEPGQTPTPQPTAKPLRATLYLPRLSHGAN